MTDLPRPIVEIEEDVYRYEPPNNGAGPMWCHGSTCIVRMDGDVFASGLETMPGAKPLNNCVPMLFRRTDSGWEPVYKAADRTREPSPLACLDGRILLSVNPTLTPPDTYSGPAQPQILEFSAVTVPLSTPIRSFFTATERGGSQASQILDVFGDVGHTMRYVRIKIF